MPASRRDAPRPPPRVALLIEASNAYGRGLLAGIHRHLREQEPWTIFLPEHGRGMPPLEMLSGWRGDGIIARIETPAIATAIEKLQRGGPLAVVDVSAARLLPGVPYVETDDAAIARLAAEHFSERDFRQLAFLGDERFRWSSNRRDAFLAAAGGRPVTVYQPRGRVRTGAAEDEAIEAWLRSLPKPVGLFACYDIRGRQALEACRRAGLAVPDQVAVLGVDDDAVLCGLASPPLSSVIPDALGAGRLAAELLGALLRGERLERDEWLLPPLGIATRQSTDVLAIDDEMVAAAVRQIREHACAGIKVADVVRSLGVSRRVLESRASPAGAHAPRGDRPGAVPPCRAAARRDRVAAGHDRRPGRLPASGNDDGGLHPPPRPAAEPLAASAIVGGGHMTAGASPGRVSGSGAGGP